MKVSNKEEWQVLVDKLQASGLTKSEFFPERARQWKFGLNAFFIPGVHGSLALSREEQGPGQL